MTAPKFGKVELLLVKNDKIDIANRTSIPQTEKIVFEDCGLMITGDYIIVIIDEKDIEKTLTSTGKIFHLSQVSAYKTHAQ